MSASWGVPMSVFVQIQTLLVERVHPLTMDWINGGTLGIEAITFLLLSVCVCMCFLPLSPTLFCCLFCAIRPTKADVAEGLEQADVNLPWIFTHCTWVLNGTHTPIVLYKSRGERYKDYYSFLKTKKPSLNNQVCIICPVNSVVILRKV